MSRIRGPPGRAPGASMLFWFRMRLFSGHCLWVCRQEMPQRHEELACVVAIVPVERGANVIPQHVPDRLGAPRPRKPGWGGGGGGGLAGGGLAGACRGRG